MRYTYEEIEPVAGDRRFAFRGPGIAADHLGVFLESADEAECVRRLLESAFAAGALARAEAKKVPR